QGSTDPGFGRRASARAVVGEVIEVGAIGHDGESTRSGSAGEMGPEGSLAEVAAIPGIGGVIRIVELTGRDFDQVQIEKPGGVDRLAVLSGGERVTHSD